MLLPTSENIIVFIVARAWFNGFKIITPEAHIVFDLIDNEILFLYKKGTFLHSFRVKIFLLYIDTIQFHTKQTIKKYI